MNELWQDLRPVLQDSIPTIAAAVGTLVIGWLVALLVTRLVRVALQRTTLDDRLAGLIGGKATDLSAGVSRTVFYLLMLLVLVAVLQVLNLTMVTEPLTGLANRVFEFLPQLGGAAILALVAWALATILRRVVATAARAGQVDERLSTDTGGPSVAASLGEAVFWLVILLFLPAIVGALGLQGLLVPVQNLLDQVLRFLPQLGAAAVIGLVGWFLARLVSRIVTSLLAATGLDRVGTRLGLSADAASGRTLSGLVGLVVYVWILVPVLISALNALQLRALTEPASRMLEMSFAALPTIFAAGVVLALAWAIGKLVSGLAATLLEAAGLDRLVERIGLRRADSTGRSPSAIAGTLVFVTVILFAAMEAAELLNFDRLAALLSDVLAQGGEILLGLLVLGAGLWLANLAASTLRSASLPHSAMLARAAWIAVMVLFTAMGLRRMGLANEIVELAFGLLLGAAAIAAAVAFGIGGRDVAGRTLERWVGSAPSGPSALEAGGSDADR